MKTEELNRKPDPRRKTRNDSGRNRRAHVVSTLGPAWKPEILMVAAASPFFHDLAAGLQEQGCRVCLASPVDCNLKEWESSPPDLVIVDLRAGTAPALQVVEKFLAFPQRPKVMVLGQQGKPLPASVFALEVDEYLLLPAGPEAVQRLAVRCLGRPTPRTRAGAEELAAALNLRALFAVQQLAGEAKKRLVFLAADLRRLTDAPEAFGGQGAQRRLAALSTNVEDLLALTETFLSRRVKRRKAAAVAEKRPEDRGVVIDLPLHRRVSASS